MSTQEGSSPEKFQTQFLPEDTYVCESLKPKNYAVRSPGEYFTRKNVGRLMDKAPGSENVGYWQEGRKEKCQSVVTDDDMKEFEEAFEQGKKKAVFFLKNRIFGLKNRITLGQNNFIFELKDAFI